MNIDSMRELFGQEDTYFNVVFSDRKLSIPSGKLYSSLSRQEIEKSSEIFVNMMMNMIYTLLIVSAVIFCVVMYLMMKVMIDRSAFGISLVKIFGYRMKEIRKLYLNGNFYVICCWNGSLHSVGEGCDGCDVSVDGKQCSEWL